LRTTITILVIISCFCSCIKKFDARVPDTRWGSFDSANAAPIAFRARQKLEGVFTITAGNDEFGNLAAAKWSYVANGADTSFYLSFFCENEVPYIICEARRQDSNILLNGYWRQMINTSTGKARLVISANKGGRALLSGAIPDSIVIEGNFGNDDAVPVRPLKLKWLRPLYKALPLQIIAHRLGGRNSDLLPASENSLEMLRLATRFGATGVETDVRLTSDGVPIVYHDEALNERLIQKNGLLGPIENYTYAQLNTLVRLVKGERIPTLREVLNTLVYNTSLTFIWLDTKYDGSLQILRDMQVEFVQKAAAIGRTVDISIGIPDDKVLDNFLRLPGYQNVPSVCELSIEKLERANSHIWAPRWTLGTQNEEVARMHNEGRKAYVWTLDVPGNVATFLKEGHFDGILSNYPSAVAFYYYAQ
jgi:glycerophosphoryl diester phosphodiesterase